MKKHNCLVIDDNFIEQLAIEKILSEFPEINATYVSTPKAFLQELSTQKYQIFIVDIMLNDTMTGIDLIHHIQDTSAWIIISSSMRAKDVYEQYKSLKFKKFFIQKPVDKYILMTNIHSFLFSQQQKEAQEQYALVE